VFIVPSVPPSSPPRRIRQCLWAEVWLSEPVMHRPLLLPPPTVAMDEEQERTGARRCVPSPAPAFA
jgi:hypothetical protein